MLTIIGLILLSTTSNGYSNQNKTSYQQFSEAWKSDGIVPNFLRKVPEYPLYVSFGDIVVEPNTAMDTSQMQMKPTLSWVNQASDLYTVIIEDIDIINPPIKYNHWLVTNIPGEDVYNGDQVLEYIPSFHFDITAEGQLDTTLPGIQNRHMVLVYRQKTRLDLSGQAGCNPDIVEPPRITSADELQAEYNLEGPVAGNFYRVGYSPGYTESSLCYYRKCLGYPYPLLLAGVNDKPECIGENEGF